MINEEIASEILQELFSSLEALETQSAAVLSFLKDKGIASDDDLAPYLERAGNASSVRWRAARVRIEHLLSSVVKREQEDAPPEQAESADQKQRSQPETTSKRQNDSESSTEEREGNERGAASNVAQNETSDSKRERDPAEAANRDDQAMGAIATGPKPVTEAKDEENGSNRRAS